MKILFLLVTLTYLSGCAVPYIVMGITNQVVTAKQHQEKLKKEKYEQQNNDKNLYQSGN